MKGLFTSLGFIIFFVSAQLGFMCFDKNKKDPQVKYVVLGTFLILLGLFCLILMT